MKKLLLVIVYCVSFAYVANGQMQAIGRQTKKGTATVIFTCPMHPEIQSKVPGKCPKCGMELVKQKKNKTTSGGPAANVGQLPTDSLMNTHDVPAIPPAGGGHIKGPGDAGDGRRVTARLPKTVRYDLYIADTTVGYTGKKKKAIAINGSIPAPTLYFTEGDTAEIYVHNTLKKETSIHWHGVILPNKEDGVSYLTTSPIKAGQTHKFRFPVVQSGTYWYHSHTQTQEQSGMYGALVFYKRDEPAMPQQAIVLSDWTNMNPKEVDRSLHCQTDWFGIKKKSTQNYAEAIKEGHFKTKVANEWLRMLAMDVSDVAYDTFLVNGKGSNEQPQYKKGDKVRLRIVNGSSATYFWLSYAGGKVTVVANDGKDVEPVEVDRLIIAVAETYDVIVTIPDNKSYEFLVTPEDRTRHSSLWLGSGAKVAAAPLPKLKYFKGMKMMNGMMKMNGDLKEMEGMEMTNQIMDMNIVMYPEMAKNKGQKQQKDIVTLNYNMLRSPEKTTLPESWATRTFYFNLTGNMNRYVWTIDNKTVSEAGKIFIKKGENIRIVLYNNSMMRHPMHLHGHFFRVLNGQGAYAPLKNTLDIMPMERDTIEFAATESGDWFFHCHILYHMMSGMGRVFSYENSPGNPELPDKKYAQRKLFADDRMFHLMAKIGLESNGSDGMAMYANTRYKLQEMWHLGSMQQHGYESETSVGRYLGKMQWWHVFAGFDYHYKKLDNGMETHAMDLIAPNIFGNDDKNMFGQTSNKNNRSTLIAGVQYILPMLFIAELRADLDGKFRFQLGREDIPLTSRLRFNIMANTDKEYMAGFRYIATKYVSLSSHYDSDMGLGAGLTVTY